MSGCAVNEECINSIGSYECECKNGFKKDGDSCIGKYYKSSNLYSLKKNSNCE